MSKVLHSRYPFVTELVSDEYQQTPPEYRILPEVKNFVRFSLGLAKKAQSLMLLDLKEQNKSDEKRNILFD